MSESLHLIELRADNFKRLKAVVVRPNGQGVTRIIGKNGSGKTSTLDAIASALGGAAYTPEMPIRRGADRAEVVLDLGDVIVTKTWRQGSTTIVVSGKDGSKHRSPQAVLDSLVGRGMLDVTEFMRMKPVQQVETLAKLAGIDLAKLAADKKTIYDKRRDLGRQRDTAAAAVKALPEVEAPDAEVVVADLLAEMARMETVNRVKEKLAAEHKAAERKLAEVNMAIRKAEEKIPEIEAVLKAACESLAAAKSRSAAASEEELGAKVDWDSAPTEDLAPVKQKLADSQEINRKVRANQDRAKAKKLAAKLDKEYDAMTAAMAGLDEQRDASVAAAKFPVAGLGLTDDGVTLAGVPFEQGSQAEQLKASVAIGFALRPKLKLVLIRDGSLLDSDSMELLAQMCADAGAQCLIERVAGNGETGILIEDGSVIESDCKEDDS